jgi:hypothetical protein
MTEKATSIRGDLLHSDGIQSISVIRYAPSEPTLWYNRVQSGSAQGPAVVSLNTVLKPSGYMTGMELPDRLSDYQRLKKNSAPWTYMVGWLVGWMDEFLVGSMAGS